MSRPAPHPLLDPGLVAQIERAASEHPRPPLVQRCRKVSRSRSAAAKAPGPVLTAARRARVVQHHVPA